MIFLAALLAASSPSPAEETATVAAAADLQFAAHEIAAHFTAETRREVKLAFGSSGNFARQIAHGAPFQIFLSADEDFVFQLADAGKTVDRGRLYAVGRIVLMAPEGSPLAVDPTLKDLAAALANGVLLLPPDAGSRGPRDTLIEGTVASLTTLGDRVRITLCAEGGVPVSLFTAVPRHVTARYNLAEGRSIIFRLREESVRLVPQAGGDPDLDGGRVRPLAPRPPGAQTP